MVRNLSHSLNRWAPLALLRFCKIIIPEEQKRMQMSEFSFVGVIFVRPHPCPPRKRGGSLAAVLLSCLPPQSLLTPSPVYGGGC